MDAIFFYYRKPKHMKHAGAKPATLCKKKFQHRLLCLILSIFCNSLKKEKRKKKKVAALNILNISFVV